MKVQFVVPSVQILVHYFQRTIRALCRRGHSVHAIVDAARTGVDADDPSLRELEDFSGFGLSAASRPRNGWHRALRYSRELLSFARYLDFADQSVFYRNRWAFYYLPDLARLSVALPPTRALLARPTTQWILRSVERLAPPIREIVQELEEEQPDVVVASPANHFDSLELEYLKAAQKLGIPTVVAVLSWDNLTTKGAFHVAPDMTLVWNRTQLREAVDYHGIPPERIVVTGAPVFDPWFEGMPSAEDRATFCRKVGLDAQGAYLVYLGSSANIARDESWLVAKLARRLREDKDPRIREMNIMVRPHPANTEIYRNLSEPNIVLWPKDGELPNTAAGFGDFCDSLRYSVCSVGLNTSGMIDAVIADRPCIAILVPQYSLTQAETLHFKYLLQAGVVDTAAGLDQCRELIRAKTNGDDPRAGNRLQFVRSFIRPCGMEKSASALTARAIELAAEGLDAPPIETALQAMPDDSLVQSSGFLDLDAIGTAATLTTPQATRGEGTGLRDS